jgi:serine/threonine protein kinase
VVHRDLKPLNLLFRRDPDAPSSEIVLCDFGVAHLVPAAAAADRRREARGTDKELLGTLAYMAPEQRRGEEVDGRADLYAAAVILWETLVGRLPWDRDVALRGTRRDDDLRLPAEVKDTLGELAGSVEAHLLDLGRSNPMARPVSTDALERARLLVDAVHAAGHEAELAAERAALFPADR